MLKRPIIVRSTRRFSTIGTVRCAAACLALSATVASSASSVEVSADGTRPSPWQMASLEIQGAAEHTGKGHYQEGVLLRLRLPVARRVLSEASGGLESHGVRTPFEAVMKVSRADFGVRWGLSENWSAMGGLTQTTATEQGLEPSAGLTYAGRCFLMRRLTDRFTLMLGGLWSERLEGGDRLLVVPGLVWRPLPDLTVRTHQGITADYRINALDILSVHARHRAHAYRMRDRSGIADPVLTITETLLGVGYRRQTSSGVWLDLGWGLDVRPRERLRDGDGHLVWDESPAPSWNVRIAGGRKF